MSEISLDSSPDSSLGVPRRIASAIPDLALSAVCLGAWIAPSRFAPDLPRWIVITMLLEFVVIHSAPFMGMTLFAPGSTGRRALRVIGLGVFYSLFVGGFALSFHTLWPLVSFWLLTFNRMTSVLQRPADAATQRVRLGASWAAHVMCYLLGVFLTIVPPLPRFGFTPEVVASLRLPGGGLWIEQPWRVAAFGALYFGAVAAFEWSDYRAFVPRQGSATGR